MRAQEAQRTWALTTFSQRRKVLKTLLKYVVFSYYLLHIILIQHKDMFSPTKTRLRQQHV